MAVAETRPFTPEEGIALRAAADTFMAAVAVVADAAYGGGPVIENPVSHGAMLMQTAILSLMNCCRDAPMSARWYGMGAGLGSAIPQVTQGEAAVLLAALGHGLAMGQESARPLYEAQGHC